MDQYSKDGRNLSALETGDDRSDGVQNNAIEWDSCLPLYKNIKNYQRERERETIT